VTAALDLLAALVLEDGRRWGDVAAPFQVEDAAAVLDANAQPHWHFETRPRGGSKTTDNAGVAVVALAEQLPAGAQGYAVAADRDQARLLISEMGGFIRRTEGLAGLLDVTDWRVTNTATGASITALPADGPSAYGLRPSIVFVDELCQWGSGGGPRTMWEAVFSSLGKVPGARLVVLTTAGDPGHWSRAIFDGAVVSPLWRVREVPGPLPWADVEVLEEQRRLLMPSAFARLHLNQWTAPEDRLTTVDDVRACVRSGESVLPPVPGVRYRMALDLGLKSDRSVLTVAHAERDDEATVVVVDAQHVWQGSRAQPVDIGAVEATVLEVSATYGGAPLVADPWQTAQLTQRLRAAGVRCEEFVFSSGSIGKLALTLYRLLREHLLDLPDDPELVDELVNVQLRETSPGVYRLDHADGRHDDRAVSLALVAHTLLTSGGSRRRRIVLPPDPDAAPVGVEVGERLDPVTARAVARDDAGRAWGLDL